MGYVEIRDPAALDEALELAKGSYQRDLLLGYESLSGATLRGTAKNWGARYAESRANLLSRIRQAGIAVSERTGDHGKRILVIGKYPE